MPVRRARGRPFPSFLWIQAGCYFRPDNNRGEDEVCSLCTVRPRYSHSWTLCTNLCTTNNTQHKNNRNTRSLFLLLPLVFSLPLSLPSLFLSIPLYPPLSSISPFLSLPLSVLSVLNCYHTFDARLIFITIVSHSTELNFSCICIIVL